MELVIILGICLYVRIFNIRCLIFSIAVRYFLLYFMINMILFCFITVIHSYTAEILSQILFYRLTPPSSQIFISGHLFETYLLIYLLFLVKVQPHCVLYYHLYQKSGSTFSLIMIFHLLLTDFFI